MIATSTHDFQVYSLKKDIIRIINFLKGDCRMPHTIIRTGLIFTFIALGAWNTGSAAEDYWPGWLGPKRDGRVSDFRSPKKWPAKLTKVWTVKVGAGYGSPLVAKGKVWQHAREGEDEVIHCLDLATGKSQWSQRYPTPFKIGGGADRHGKGPKSSPVYA
ncbi:MAG: hypothetical protein VCA18_01045, partial [Opitutales bacterium]